MVVYITVSVMHKQTSNTQIIIMFSEWLSRISKVCLNIKAITIITFIGCMIILFHFNFHYKLNDQTTEHTNLNPSHILTFSAPFYDTLQSLDFMTLSCTSYFLEGT